MDISAKRGGIMYMHAWQASMGGGRVVHGVGELCV